MDQKDKAKLTFGFYWRHAARYPRYLTGIIIGIPITMLVNIFLPNLILADVLSRLAAQDFTKGDIWTSFGPQLVLYGVLLLSGVLVWRFIDHNVWNVEAKVSKDLAEEVFSNMIAKSA